MALYPSLEDAEIDSLAKTQLRAEVATAIAGSNGATADGSGSGVYGTMLSELEAFDSAFGGLDVSEQSLAQHLPRDQLAVYSGAGAGAGAAQPLVSVTQPGDRGIALSTIRNGVREVVACKDPKTNKVGIAVDSWDKGVFIAFVWQDSPAAMAGLRFGDQILQINGVSVAGWSAAKTLKTIKEAPSTEIRFHIRDRVMMRTYTVQKDSANHCGFLFKGNNITAVVQDSSAARNGIMIHHNIVEVNGQSVLGLSGDELLKVIQSAPSTCTFTICPNFVYKHLTSNIKFDRIKQFMHRGEPQM